MLQFTAPRDFVAVKSAFFILIFNILDFFTTKIALSLGAEEGNPMSRSLLGHNILLAYKIGIPIGILCLSPFVKTIGLKMTMRTVATVYSLIVLWNSINIIRILYVR